MLPPSSVKIGPHWWTVELGEPDPMVDRDAKGKKKPKEDVLSLGSTDVNKLQIVIKKDAPPGLIAETLFHELMHACYSVVGNPLDMEWADDMDLEELSISMLSPLMWGMFRDNPDLVRYLLMEDHRG